MPRVAEHPREVFLYLPHKRSWGAVFPGLSKSALLFLARRRRATDQRALVLSGCTLKLKVSEAGQLASCRGRVLVEVARVEMTGAPQAVGGRDGVQTKISG